MNPRRMLLSYVIGCFTGMALIAGCGGKQPAPEPQADGSATAAPEQRSPDAAPSREQPRQVAEVDPKRKETQWIGEIPYDVFYDKPLEVAVNTTAVGSPDGISTSTPDSTPQPAAETPATAEMKPDDGKPDASPSGDGPDWAAILPMEFLVDEVKALRTRLTANLQTVATYNQNNTDVSLDGAMLAAMAAIATVHSESTSWKENAHFIRDLAYDIYMNAEGTGRTPFTESKEPFEQVTTILDGGPAPETDAEPVVDFSDLIYVSETMKRIDASFTSLKSDVNTEARMKEDPLAVERELRVLAALGTMIGTETYENTEEEEYQQFLKRFIEGSLAAADAVKAENFEGFQSGLNQVQTVCGDCHRKYQGVDSGF
jgi:hypothetical protein